MIDSGFKGLYDKQLASVNKVFVMLFNRITPKFKMSCKEKGIVGFFESLKRADCIVD